MPTAPGSRNARQWAQTSPSAITSSTTSTTSRATTSPNRPWDVNLEAEVRQPLLQGAGAEFNRIAGPNGVPGRFHGVLLGRLNTDVSLAEFEIGVSDFVSDVEDAYWQLCYAYRDLDAKRAARDRALETWRRIHALYVNGRRGGEAEKEAQAREQYFRLHQEVETRSAAANWTTAATSRSAAPAASNRPNGGCGG